MKFGIKFDGSALDAMCFIGLCMLHLVVIVGVLVAIIN